MSTESKQAKSVELGDSGVSVNGTLTPDQVQQLVEQNNQLRQRLKDFNLAMDRALRQTSGSGGMAKAGANARVFSSLQDSELANMHVRMDLLRKENEALRSQRAKDQQADRVTELENELRFSQTSEKKARDEIKTLTLELK